MATHNFVPDDYSRLRTIVVSGRTELNKTSDPRELQRIRLRMVQQLGELENSILNDGADPDMLFLIRHIRGDRRPPEPG